MVGSVVNWSTSWELNTFRLDVKNISADEYICRLSMSLSYQAFLLFWTRWPACFNTYDSFMVCTKFTVFDGSNRVLLFSAFGIRCSFRPHVHSHGNLVSFQIFQRCKYFHGSGTFSFQKGLCDVSLGKHYQVKSSFSSFEEWFLTVI